MLFFMLISFSINTKIIYIYCFSIIFFCFSNPNGIRWAALKTNFHQSIIKFDFTPVPVIINLLIALVIATYNKDRSD